MKISGWQKKHVTLANLLDNSRFYILADSVLASLLAVFWLRLNIASDQLFYIRSEQVFGFVALGYWYLALLISPLTFIFGKEGKMKQIVFARRAIGVSAFYFAALHGSIALWGQLGGLGGLALLPAKFQLALAFGAAGLVILIIMAATSFDKVVAYMTFPRWKLLHRLGYIAGILTMLHVWIIGTHLEQVWVKIAIFGLISLLIALEAYRTATNLRKLKFLAGVNVIALAVFIWFVASCALLIIPNQVTTFHGDHPKTGDGSGHGH